MKAKKIIKWIAGILGAILIGAIGSGVWSGILSPALYWFIDIVMRFLSGIFEGVKDNLYLKAAESLNEYYSFKIYNILHAVLIGLCVFLLFKISVLLFQRPEKKVSKSVTTKGVLISWQITVCVFIGVFFSFIVKSSYIYSIKAKSLNSLEIIAPFIEQKEYLSLKSDFYRIKNSEDYENFYKKMVQLSNKYQIELPLFEPL